MLRSRIEWYQLVTDVLIGIASLHGAFLLRTTVPVGRPAVASALITPPPLFLIMLLIWLAIFYQNQVYVRRFGTRFRFRVLNLVRSHIIAGFLYFGVLYLTFRDVSRLQSVYFLTLFVAGTVLARIIALIVQVRYFENDESKSHVVVVGTGPIAVRLAELIRDNPRNNLTLLGFFRLRDDEEADEALSGPVLGDAGGLVNFVGQRRVDEVIIATNWYSEPVAQAISKIMYDLQRYPVSIRLAPDYSQISYFHIVTENFEGLPLIGLRTPIFTPSQRLLKRSLDIAISLSIVLVGLPIFALVALAIRLDSPGPIILRQKRVGIHGRPFDMFKFRSMYNNIDQNLFDETKLDIIKRPDDPRVTRVGRLLRRTSLDELPQLINVLRGDMSLVGPRPELPARVQEYAWWQFKRFEVPQGMTGWWQINGRANRPMHLHTEDDLYYIQNYSLWLDLQILWRTVRVVFTGEGAF